MTPRAGFERLYAFLTGKLDKKAPDRPPPPSDGLANVLRLADAIRARELDGSSRSRPSSAGSLADPKGGR